MLWIALPSLSGARASENRPFASPPQFTHDVYIRNVDIANTVPKITARSISNPARIAQTIRSRKALHQKAVDAIRRRQRR
jgi:hypothetical protein